MANYEGDNRDNTYRGTKKRDVINGGGGDDVLFGLDGNDEIDGGAGRDTINAGTGDDDADGGRGNDTLIFDHAAGASRFQGTIEFEWWSSGYSGVLASSLGKTRFAEFETIEATLGRGNDTVVFDGAGLASKGNVSIDAGDGVDLLEANFRANRGVSFVVGKDGTATTRNGVFANFEAFELKLGEGRNTVTTGRLRDTISSLLGGVDTVNGGDGYDTYQWRARGSGGMMRRSTRPA